MVNKRPKRDHLFGVVRPIKLKQKKMVHYVRLEVKIFKYHNKERLHICHYTIAVN